MFSSSSLTVRQNAFALEDLTDTESFGPQPAGGVQFGVQRVAPGGVPLWLAQVPPAPSASQQLNVLLIRLGWLCVLLDSCISYTGYLAVWGAMKFMNVSV